MTDAFVGGAMSPEDEAEFRSRHFAELADEAEAAVKTIETKIAGMKEALAAKKTEAKQLRTEARKGDK